MVWKTRRTALIVGAGIGGLSAAVALRLAGWHVRVFERASSPRELGFALMLAPNALRSLQELDLADKVEAQGVSPTHVEIRQPSGRVLRRLDLTVLNRSARPRVVVALRQALHGTLIEAVGRDRIEVNRCATGVIWGTAGMTVAFADGTSARGDLLIGADGVGSLIRRVVHPVEPPSNPSGYIAVRGVTHGAAGNLNGLDGVTYLGNAVEASLARASATSVYWYMSLLTSDVGPERNASAVLERHSSTFDRQFKAITRAAQDLRVDELFERDPLRRWGRGPVTLLGDAAHPMLPHAGQGAAQAIEDAVALALALSNDAPIEPALRHYEHVRERRTRRIAGLSHRIAGTTTTRNVFVRGVRDAAVRLVPQRLLVNAFARTERRDVHIQLRQPARAK